MQPTLVHTQASLACDHCGMYGREFVLDDHLRLCPGCNSDREWAEQLDGERQLQDAICAWWRAHGGEPLQPRWPRYREK